MAGRHLSRSIVMQTLFEWESRNLPKEELAVILARNTEEFASGSGDDAFIESLLSGVLKNQTKIDDIIVKAAPEWPLEKIATIDRNVLRIGLYELLFANSKEVPPKVAINEAIELAKNFGGESSGKFVNGVLGSVYRELGEPGKDQQSKKRADIPFEEMEILKLAGAVVYAWKDRELFFAFVHDIFGHWTLSKGKAEKGETFEETAIREIKEELGLDILIVETLGDNEYISSHPEKIKIRKQVKYFLAEAKYKELRSTEDKNGLDDSRWFSLEDVAGLNFYEDIFPIVTKAVGLLLQK